MKFMDDLKEIKLMVEDQQQDIPLLIPLMIKSEDIKKR